MLQLKKVSFSYGGTPVLKDFSLTVEDGQAVCLQGESGCGKTTAIRLLLGLEHSLFGVISAPERISAVFQEDRLVENRSVQRNLLAVLPRTRWPDTRHLNALLNSAGLQGMAHRRVAGLSGGQKRRVALLRAVLYDGDALILDEPFNGLDRDSKLRCAQLVQEMFLQKGRPVLVVSHMTEDAVLLHAQTVKMVRQSVEEQ